MNDTVYLYVFDTMADWEVGYLTAEIQSGRYWKKGCSPLKFVTLSNKKEPIKTMGGLMLLPDLGIDQLNLDGAAALILPGGDTWLDKIHDPILSITEKFLSKGSLVAAICGATMGLARAGFLNQRYHTSNDLGFLKMVCPNYTGEKYYREELAVTDENLITASGIAPLDFTVHVLKKLDLFLPEALSSWEKLYKTQKAEYFFDLMRLTQ